MPDVPATVLFPEWLLEAARAAALKQGQSLDDMLRLVAYEYVEIHAPERLSLPDGRKEEIPAIIRMANAVLVNALDKQASEVRLIPQPERLLVNLVLEEGEETLYDWPNHVKPQIYDRYVSMASHWSQIPGAEALFEVTSKGRNCRVFVTWNGSYQSEMTLRFQTL